VNGQALPIEPRFGFANDEMMTILDVGGNQVAREVNKDVLETPASLMMSADTQGVRLATDATMVIVKQLIASHEGIPNDDDLSRHWRDRCCLLLSFPLNISPLIAQTTPKKDEQQKQMGGVSTGAPVTYTSKRTVGIFDPTGPIVFEDVTEKTALASFRHRSGSVAKDYIFETPSGGVALFDYDGDGRPDIYLVNGSTLLRWRKERPPRAALSNLGNWKFKTLPMAGVAMKMGFGVAVDYIMMPADFRRKLWNLSTYNMATVHSLLQKS
jgi:hypothetical protein